MTDNGGGKYTVDITSDKDVFKEKIDEKHFCVLGQDDGTEIGDKFINDKYIEKNSVKAEYNYIDAKTVQIKITDSKESDYYTVYIHKDATLTGNYAAAFADKEAEEEDSVTITTDILSVKSNVGEFDFEVELTNATFAENITADNLSLSQGFADMLVKELVRTSDTAVKVIVEGTIDSSYSVGEIVFDENAVSNNLIISLSIGIEDARIYADFSTAVFENNQLTFDVSLDGGTFSDDIVEAELSGFQQGIDAGLENVVINEERDIATLTLNISAADIDTALELINGAVLSFSAESTDFNEDVSMVLNIRQAVLNANVDFVEQNETNYSATLIMSAFNGTLEELSVADITSISGTFKDYTPEAEDSEAGETGETSDGNTEAGVIYNVTVTKVKKIDEGTQVVFTFDCDELDLDNSVFEGTLALASGKLKNLWATESNENSAALYYSAAESKGGTRDTLKGLWGTYGDTISTYASGAATAFKVGKTVLEMTGVIESAEAKMDKIYDAIVSLQADVSAIKNQLASIESRLIELQDITNKVKYDTAAAARNSFYYGSDYKQLRNKITNYNAFIESGILSFLNGDKKLTLYYDVNGDITVPKAGNPAVSYRDIAIDTEKTSEYDFGVDWNFQYI